MENEDNEKKEIVEKSDAKPSATTSEKSHPLAKDVDEDKGEGGVDGEGEENEPSATTTHIHRRLFKKPKPYFYVGGCNGAHLVEENLTALGWERITDKTREDFKLKWCEIKSHNNYHSFRDGEQLCYQIPNNKLLTTKIGLLTSLQEYDRVMNKVKKGRPRIMKYQDFFPETYRLDVKDDRELFFETYVENEVWISKPTGMNQGKGIYLIRSKEDIVRLQEKLAEAQDDVQNSRKLPFKIPMARIVQRYVEKPLLLEGRKFDVRNYLLIACTNPLVVFYSDGYCRLTCMPYDKDSTDLTGHLTNQFMQKKNPMYEEFKEETVWSMDRFNDYVNEHFADEKKLPEDWVHTVLKRRCQQVMLHCFQAVRHKLECRLGFFDLIGCDFLVDEDFKISLLEMNCNPALHTNCDTLKEVIPDIVSETLQLALEIFEKANKRERIMPLVAQNNFVLLYNGDSIEAAERRERLQSAAEARRRARSAQRRKKFVPGQYVYKRTINNQTTATPTTTITTASNGPTSTSSSAQNNLSTNNLTYDANLSSTETPTSSSPASIIPPYRAVNLPSSTVTALTMASQQRVTKSKSISTTTLKPFYAGGTVATSRPYSAPKVNRKYAQVESKVMSHNNLYLMESPRRDNMNNAALNAATNSKVVNYIQKAKSLLLTPKREDVLEVKDLDATDPITLDEDSMIDGRNVDDYLERENLFERILEEADEMDLDEENEEDLLGLGSSPSPELMRRPSAKLPPHYHASAPQTTLLAGNPISSSSSSWPRYSHQSQTIQKKISRIATLSVKGSIDLPLPSVHIPYNNMRSPFEQSNKVQYRTPTTVRIRQSLPATTCTLEIGPKARRGLIAVSPPGKQTSPTANEFYSSSRKLNNTARLKLINTCHNNESTVVPEDNSELISSALNYLATNHLPVQADQETSSLHTSGSVPVTGSLVHGASPLQYSFSQNSSQVQTNYGRAKADSFTQTTRKVNGLFSGEEKVIWRLRSRVAENTPRAGGDGYSSPVSQLGNKKVPLKVPVVTQSPSLISPRKGIDPLTNRRVVLPSKKNSLSTNSGGAMVTFNSNYSKSPRSSAEGKDLSLPQFEGDTDSCMCQDHGLPEKTTALSKVVAIATAVPTHMRSSEGKAKSSNEFNEEPSMLAAG